MGSAVIDVHLAELPAVAGGTLAPGTQRSWAVPTAPQLPGGLLSGSSLTGSVKPGPLGRVTGLHSPCTSTPESLLHVGHLALRSPAERHRLESQIWACIYTSCTDGRRLSPCFVLALYGALSLSAPGGSCTLHEGSSTVGETWAPRELTWLPHSGIALLYSLWKGGYAEGAGEEGWGEDRVRGREPQSLCCKPSLLAESSGPCSGA